MTRSQTQCQLIHKLPMTCPLSELAFVRNPSWAPCSRHFILFSFLRVTALGHSVGMNSDRIFLFATVLILVSSLLFNSFVTLDPRCQQFWITIFLMDKIQIRLALKHFSAFLLYRDLVSEVGLRFGQLLLANLPSPVPVEECAVTVEERFNRACKCRYSHPSRIFLDLKIINYFSCYHNLEQGWYSW